MRMSASLARVLALLLPMLLLGGDDPILSLLPGGGVPPGWARQGEARQFVGPELYRHIDGGAEPYHRHGFDRLAVQDYAGGGLEVRVEIYRMTTPGGALAMFSELASGLPTAARFGSSCVLDDYQILFLRGGCIVSLTAYESGAETAAAMAALAGRIDAALASSSF